MSGWSCLQDLKSQVWSKSFVIKIHTIYEQINERTVHTSDLFTGCLSRHSCNLSKVLAVQKQRWAHPTIIMIDFPISCQNPLWRQLCYLTLSEHGNNLPNVIELILVNKHPENPQITDDTGKFRKLPNCLLMNHLLYSVEEFYISIFILYQSCIQKRKQYYFSSKKYTVLYFKFLYG